MTVVLSIDEQLARRAQQIAESRGISLEQLVLRYLEDLTEQPSAEADIAELRSLSGQGNSRGWRFNRDEIYRHK